MSGEAYDGYADIALQGVVAFIVARVPSEVLCYHDLMLVGEGVPRREERGKVGREHKQL